MKYLMVIIFLLAPALAAAAQADVVRSAFTALVDAGGFRGHASGNVFGPGLPALEGEVDVLFPDRIHVRSSEIEFVAAGEHGWVRALGFWAPTDRDLLPVTAFDMRRVRQAIDAIGDVRVEGSAVTSQCRAHVYRFRSAGQLPTASAQADVRAWICDGKPRLARVQATSAGSGQAVTFDFDWSRRPSVDAPE